MENPNSQPSPDTQPLVVEIDSLQYTAALAMVRGFGKINVDSFAGDLRNYMGDRDPVSGELIQQSPIETTEDQASAIIKDLQNRNILSSNMNDDGVLSWVGSSESKTVTSENAQAQRNKVSGFTGRIMMKFSSSPIISEVSKQSKEVMAYGVVGNLLLSKKRETNRLKGVDQSKTDAFIKSQERFDQDYTLSNELKIIQTPLGYKKSRNSEHSIEKNRKPESNNTLSDTHESSQTSADATAKEIIQISQATGDSIDIIDKRSNENSYDLDIVNYKRLKTNIDVISAKMINDIQSQHKDEAIDPAIEETVVVKARKTAANIIAEEELGLTKDDKRTPDFYAFRDSILRAYDSFQSNQESESKGRSPETPTEPRKLTSEQLKNNEGTLAERLEAVRRLNEEQSAAEAVADNARRTALDM